MHISAKRAISAMGVLGLAFSLFAAPASAGVTVSGDGKEANFKTLRTNLDKEDRLKFEKLSTDQQEKVLAAALNPESIFKAGTGDWKEVQETTLTGSVASPSNTALTGIAQTAAVKKKTDTHKKTWKLFGVKYASLEARMTYQYNGKTVTAINSCGGFYSNLIPLRKIQSIATPYFESKKTKAVCEITWQVSKVGGLMEGKSVQGLRVDGKGSRVAFWDYDA